MAADYYEVLQIKLEANTEEIHRAYRELAMRYHPDRNATPDAAARMAALNEAYSVLGEPARRRRYDHERTKVRSLDIAGPILRAAHDALRKQGWIVSVTKPVDLPMRTISSTVGAVCDRAFFLQVERFAHCGKDARSQTAPTVSGISSFETETS